jgi:hypothetical protein
MFFKDLLLFYFSDGKYTIDVVDFGVDLEIFFVIYVITKALFFEKIWDNEKKGAQSLHQSLQIYKK